jgi:hypothetical protein
MPPEDGGGSQGGGANTVLGDCRNDDGSPNDADLPALDAPAPGVQVNVVCDSGNLTVSYVCDPGFVDLDGNLVNGCEQSNTQALEASVLQVVFPETAVGGSSAAELTLSNGDGVFSAGPPTLLIDGGEFQHDGGCAASVPPNGSCTLHLRFTPSQAGERVGTLTIVTGDVQRSVALAGTGTPSP